MENSVTIKNVKNFKAPIRNDHMATEKMINSTAIFSVHTESNRKLANTTVKAITQRATDCINKQNFDSFETMSKVIEKLTGTKLYKNLSTDESSAFWSDTVSSMNASTLSKNYIYLIVMYRRHGHTIVNRTRVIVYNDETGVFEENI
jgi:hypothetical protein